jgi:hypothetical protein
VCAVFGILACYYDCFHAPASGFVWRRTEKMSGFYVVFFRSVWRQGKRGGSRWALERPGCIPTLERGNDEGFPFIV